MGSITTEIAHDFSPFFRVHKDGRIERFRKPEFTPTSDDPQSAVRSKDVVISTETAVSVRLFLPTAAAALNQKLPVLIYVHGGGFCLGSASSPKFHHFAASLADGANVIAVSVDYRLAPDHPLPIAYEDSWDALKWVFSHSDGAGAEPWLNDHADFGRVFVGGDSAGANIANNVAIRAGIDGLKFLGLILIHPYFGGKGFEKMYKYMCPSSSGFNDDPRLNPAMDPGLPKMACERVLFCLAEKDWLVERGREYYEALGKSGWGGERAIMETEGEGHGFHLFDPNCEKTAALMKQLVSFLTRD
ncbi:Carboxylesterase 13 [Actinidia chinensis var. chinensis]|uniref:Carboxylesterase 13 n=1 Tax=Actinidia chinensis var. chinensis TaxID=1590841 RepID=A0A2R6R1S2_ACTCC|nr:Carboxylesterase 13 [Actinidia chinensis var. chinensis]